MPIARREFLQLGALSALALPMVLVRWSSGPAYDRVFMLASAAAFVAAIILGALAAGGIVRRQEVALRVAAALVVTGLFVGLLPLTCGA
jgi:hypothetical protein